MPVGFRIFAYSTFFVVYRCFRRFLQHPIATHHRFRYEGQGLAALFDVNPRSTRAMNVLSGCCSTRSSLSVSLTITMARRRLHRVGANHPIVMSYSNRQRACVNPGSASDTRQTKFLALFQNLDGKVAADGRKPFEKLI